MNPTEQSIIAEQYINDCYPGCSDIDKQGLTICFHAGANWQASQHSHTEHKAFQSVEDIINEMGSTMPYFLNESIRPYIYEAMQIYAKQFYTQEQMIAFGERVKQECASGAVIRCLDTNILVELPALLHKNKLRGIEIAIDKQSILSINISKLLKK